jgi:hypothetical protein
MTPSLMMNPLSVSGGTRDSVRFSALVAASVTARDNMLSKREMVIVVSLVCVPSTTIPSSMPGRTAGGEAEKPPLNRRSEIAPEPSCVLSQGDVPWDNGHDPGQSNLVAKRRGANFRRGQCTITSISPALERTCRQPCGAPKLVCFTLESTPTAERGCICRDDGLGNGGRGTGLFLHCGAVNHWFVNDGSPVVVTPERRLVESFG